MPKILKYSILTLLLFFLLVPRPAFAFIIGDIVSFLDHLSESVEEMAQPMISIMWYFLIAWLLGLLSLGLSSLFLQTVINQQGELLTALNNMTQAGWNFTSGLANMLLALVFLVIAFAFILKIETFQAKKALPKLIIVALLLNFSLLFVQMLFDISQIVFNTILEAGGDNLFITVMKTFLGGGISIFIGIITWVTAIIVAWSIPFVHQFAQIVFVALFGVIFLPNIVIWAFQIVCFFTLSLMFGAFIFLFAARVFIVQMLAMLAPLAFLCLILPQTQKWWSEWFKHLIEWLTLGIFWLFFLVLGFKGIGLLIPEMAITGWDVTVPLPGFSWVQIGQYVFYYFCIFVYMAVILYLSQKYRPVLSQALIDFGKQGIGFVWATGLKPFGGAMRKRVQMTAAESPQVQEWATKQASAKTPELRGLGRLAAPVVVPAYALRRRVGIALGPGAIEAEKSEISKAESEAEKIQTPGLLVSKYRSEPTDSGRIGDLSAAIKKGGPFKDKMLEQVSIEEAIRIGVAANRIGAVPEAERIARSVVNKLNENQLKQMGFKSYDQLTPEKKAEWDAKRYKTIANSLVGEAKGDEIKDFAKNFWTSPEAMEAVQKFWGGSQLSRAANEFGRTFVEDYIKAAETIRPSIEESQAWYLRNNPQVLLYLSGNAAQDLGFRSLGGLSREEIREAINRWREEKGRSPSGTWTPPSSGPRETGEERRKRRREAGLE